MIGQIEQSKEVRMNQLTPSLYGECKVVPKNRLQLEWLMKPAQTINYYYIIITKCIRSYKKANNRNRNPYLL